MSVNSSDSDDDAGVNRHYGYRHIAGDTPDHSPPAEAQKSSAHKQSAPDECTQNSSGDRWLPSAANDLNGSNDKHIGMRLLRTVILACCYFLLELVVKAVTVLQFAFFAWKKRPHAGMQRLGAMIAEYMQALWRYCTFASDDAPWPFRPWPRGGGQAGRET